MRIWHKDLLPYLPLMQIRGQYREIFLIIRELKVKGTPNHILVNKINNYPLTHLAAFLRELIKEMDIRKIKYNADKVSEAYAFLGEPGQLSPAALYDGWHNERYLKQCLYNLQEKADCGRPEEKEWQIIERQFKQYL